MADFGKKKNQNKDEFVFDEDGDLPFEDEEEYAEFAPSLMKGGGGRGGGGGSSTSSRTVMLLLVLAALGGGAYYFLVMAPASSSAPAQPAAPRKTVVVIPKPTAPSPSATAPAPPTSSQPAAKPVVVPPVAATPPPVTPAPVTKPAPAPTAPTAPTTAVKPVPAPVAAKPVPAPVAAKPVASTPPPAVVKPATTPVAVPPAAPTVREPAAVVKPEATPPLVATGDYTLLGGSFVTKAGLLDAERKARRLGYTPQIKEIRRPVTMIRLRIGYFTPAEAEAQRKALSRKIPGVFTLKEGNQVALYAASHYNLDQARSYADKLFQQGIHVEEEAVEVVMPLKQLRYGDFASHAAAEKVGKQARKLGLEAVVVKR